MSDTLNTTTSDFSAAENQRYQRHFQLPGFSAVGQLALKQARVLVVGVGGLGCPATQYLVAAGVGQLTLLDGDSVSLSNLQRQVLFSSHDIGQPKASTAKRQLQALNAAIDITALDEALSIANAGPLIARHDLILDCTDNFYSRYLINDLCSSLKKPWLYSSVLGFGGQLALFTPGNACFRCLFPEQGDTPDCNQAGVLGVVPGLMGVLQATEAIKYLAQLPGSLANTLLQVDGLEPAFKSFRLQRDADCLVCAGKRSVADNLADYQPDSQRQALDSQYQLSPAEFTHALNDDSVQLIDVRSVAEHQQANPGGVCVPLEQILANDYDFNRDQQYLLYCQRGQRSQQAVRHLLIEGFSRIKSLAGGIDALQARTSSD